MKVISLYPEHVEGFRRGLRTIDTRSWSTSYRGPLALYATKRDPLSKEAFDDPIASAVMWALGELEGTAHRADLVRGAIALVVDLVDCLPIFEDPLDCPEPGEGGPFIYADPDSVQIHDAPDEFTVPTFLEGETHYGMFDQGNYGLVLANPRPIEPVRLPRSQVPQGRPWDLRGDALDQVLAQLKVRA